jgi:hypothetical protein
VPSGTVLGLAAPIIAAGRSRNSDQFKADHEAKMQDRKAKHEAKVRDEQSVYKVATDYVEVCTDVLENTIELKDAFNAIRDMVYAPRVGADDPKADDEIDQALKASEEMKRIMKPYNKMRVVADGLHLRVRAHKPKRQVTAIAFGSGDTGLERARDGAAVYADLRDRRSRVGGPGSGEETDVGVSDAVRGGPPRCLNIGASGVALRFEVV